MRGLFIVAVLMSVVLVISSSGYLAVMQTVAPWIVDALPTRISGMALTAPIMVTLLAVLVGMLVIVAMALIGLVLMALFRGRAIPNVNGTGIPDKR